MNDIHFSVRTSYNQNEISIKLHTQCKIENYIHEKPLTNVNKYLYFLIQRKFDQIYDLYDNSFFLLARAI